jgi:hypothetical protein
MPNLFNDIGRGFDRLLRCKSVNPCFLLFFMCIAGCGIATGVIYLMKGPGEIIEIALFSVTIILIFLLFCSHAYYVNTRRQRSEPLENV